MAAHEMALRMLATAPDDNGDRYNYRLLVACLQASKLTQWLVRDGGYTRLQYGRLHPNDVRRYRRHGVGQAALNLSTRNQPSCPRMNLPDGWHCTCMICGGKWFHDGPCPKCGPVPANQSLTMNTPDAKDLASLGLDVLGKCRPGDSMEIETTLGHTIVKICVKRDLAPPQPTPDKEKPCEPCTAAT